MTRILDTAVFNSRWTRTISRSWCWGRAAVMRPRRCWARSNDGLNRWLMTLMKSGRAAPYRCDRKRLVGIIVFLCPVTYNLQKLLALLLLLWTLCNLICLAYMRWLLIFVSLPSSFPQKRWREGTKCIFVLSYIVLLFDLSSSLIVMFSIAVPMVTHRGFFPASVWETWQNYFLHFRAVCLNNNSFYLLGSVSSKLHISGWVIIDERQNWICCGTVWEVASNVMWHTYNKLAVQICQNLTPKLQPLLSMEQNSPWKVDTCSSGQEMPSIVWNLKIHYLVYKIALPDPVLS